MSEIIVYTAITNGYDQLKPVPEAWKQNARFVAFLDKPQAVPGWEVRPIHRRFCDPCRNAKIHKILSHRYFPDAKYSLWVDGSVLIKSILPLEHLISDYLGKNDLAVFRHRLRNCLYDEGAICLQLGYDSDEVITRQMQKYFASGYPYQNGLAECTVLFRRHNSRIKRFNETWYQEIKNGSRRDQLSFNYVAHNLGVKCGYIPGSISSNPHFDWQRHLSLRNTSLERTKLKSTRVRSVVADKASVSMVYLYYDNPQMLMKQIECWNTYASVFKKMPEVLLIDDGSPRTFAADIVQKNGCLLPIKVFRIKQDIPWNFAGARNLGCLHAENWIYISDIDTLLFPKDAQALFEKLPLNMQCFYMPKRLLLPDMRKADPGIVNLLFHKQKYVEVGGYDEDYAGHYGKEETDYFDRLKRVAKMVNREDVLIGVMPPSLIPDARTKTTSRMKRDKARNNEIYLQKKTAGFAAPINPLRFSWERLL